MKRASIISIVYLLFGIAWIYLSDHLLFTNSPNDPGLLWQISNSKDYVFVIISSALIFFLIYQAFLNLHKQQKGTSLELKEKNALINNTQDFIWSIDCEMRLRSCNEPFLRRVKQVAGKDLHAGDSLLLEEYGAEQLAIWQNYYQRVLGGEVIRDTPQIMRGDQFTYFIISFHPIHEQGEIIGVSCYAKDVTEQELAQQQLKEREKWLASIFHSTTDAMGLVEIDPAGNFVYVSANQTAEILFLNRESGITMEQYYGAELVHFSTEVLKRSPEQGEQLAAYYQQVVDTRKSVRYESQYKIFNRPGLYTDTTLNPILDEAGNCSHILWVTRDITQEKTTEQAVRASRNQLNQIYHATREMMSLLKVEKGGQYRIESVNLPFLQKVQFDVSETQFQDLEGVSFYSGRGPDTSYEWRQMFRDFLPHLEEVRVRQQRHSFEWNQIQEGKARAYEVSLIPIMDSQSKLTHILVVLYDHSERLHEAEQTLIAINKAVEAERMRIARELHDSLTQTLSIVSINLKNLNYDFTGLQEQPKYQKALEYLEASIDESRSMAHRIMPKSIQDFGLIPSIEELIEQAEQAYPISIQFSFNQSPRLSEEIEINLFRLVQQALKNALSHAEATKVEVGLCFEDDALHLWIHDNGKGFDVEKESRSFKGIGLRTMRSRVLQLDGIFSIKSNPQEGTGISVQLPLTVNPTKHGD